MISITLYYFGDSDRVNNLKALLTGLKQEVPHEFIEIDVEKNVEFQNYASENFPILKVGPYTLKDDFSNKDVEIAIKSARDRDELLANNDDYRNKLLRSQSLNNSDRISFWFSKHYLLLINGVLFIYVALPFLSPVFMRLGYNHPANIIYTIYSPLCHQLAFRSFFLFGEQPYYPRSAANIPDMVTYEQISKSRGLDIIAARQFVGDQDVGYKVAICERCLAIYASMFVFGIIFALTGRKIKSLSWYFWFIIGLGPIGLDGISQLPGLAEGFLPSWLPLRESTPVLRVITGILFGVTTVWYLFPFIEESMKEVRYMLAKKIAMVNQFEQHRLRQ